ncbi:uncharacterized protein PRCAT00003839001 [Priceomyces carsonii]|uniref:uncharacterized protein n=1 Tax=Priceomyces carsonii TaxID=28549 RepID=UPI002ED97384|nr:unnamed protein product [Priceomyces carsonii]
MNQITSSEIINDAFQSVSKPKERVKQLIQDLEELKSYQLNKRKEYEQQLNKNRLNFGQWLRYAKWELNNNHDFQRARSIFERALEVNVEHVPFWVQYIQAELQNRNINHARNLLDRAVTILPRVDKLWFLYVQTEEMLKSYLNVRSVFERWLEWKPVESAWEAYINFEIRYDELDNVRDLFMRFVKAYPKGSVWLKWIEFELSLGSRFIRETFELAVDVMLGDPATKNDPDLAYIICKWAEWEVSVKEYKRARMIYTALVEKFAKDLLPDKINLIYQSYINFEKLYGEEDNIEESIVLKRQKRYEVELKQNPYDFNTWWLLLNILPNDAATVRPYFEEAIRNVPQDTKKTLNWRRFILIWIRYALWEEFNNSDSSKARQVWSDCLNVIPHKRFSFGKVWIHFAEFEIRNSNLTNARKILGRGIGQANRSKPKRSLFQFYIDLEQKLGEWDRVRKIFEKWLESVLISPTTEVSAMEVLFAYISFESRMKENNRCVALFSLGIRLAENIPEKFPHLEHLWMAFINYYKEEMMYSEARELYKQLIEKTSSPQAWISLALFEISVPNETQLTQFLGGQDETFEFAIEDPQMEKSRSVFQEANRFFKDTGSNRDRAIILNEWKDFEESYGDERSIKLIEEKLPVISKKTKLKDNVEEEYLEYIFPEDQNDSPNPPTGLGAFLANAKKWAMKDEI